MVRKLNENYGISDMIYQILDGHYLSSSGGILESTIQDEVWEKVKEKYSNEITNKRRTVTAIVWSAFIDVINYYGNEEFGRGYGWKMDQKAVQRWFKRNGVDYKEVLKPVVDSVEELRKERLNKKERLNTYLKKNTNMYESSIVTDDGNIIDLEDPTDEIIDQFRNDMYNAITNVLFKYRDYDISADEIYRLVDIFYRGYWKWLS